MSSSLTSADKKYLRGRAQTLKAMVHIGKSGLTDSVFAEIDHALEKHQLVKIQFHMEKEALLEAADIIAEVVGCECIGQIGKTASFYRPPAADSAEEDEQ